MNYRRFKKIAEQWWEENKQRLSTEDINTAKAVIQFYFAWKDAESSIEDSTKSIAFALFNGVPAYKNFTWKKLYQEVDNRYDDDLATELGLQGFLFEVQETILNNR